ncbi:MAG TPA: hypothetical protein VF278_20140 [Pirellulales bacterium]
MAGIKGDVGLLRTTVDAYRDNLRRLKSWQARIELTRLTRKSVLPRESRATIDFSYDRSRDSTTWHWSPDESAPNPGPPGSPLDPITGVRSKELGGSAHIGLIPRRSESEPRVAQVFPEGQLKPGLGAEEFDPLLFFTNQQEIGAMLDHYIEVADGARVNHTSVRRERDVVILDVDTPKRLTRFEFDLTKSGNLTFFLSDAKDTQGRLGEWRCEYAHIAGVWVPDKVTRHRLNRGTREEMDITYRWLENKVNVPVAAEAFSLERLGARPGDIVADNRAGVEFTYGDVGPEARNHQALWFIAANTAIIVVLALLSWWSRRRRVRA